MLSTQPYKGARDFYPQDMQIRNYIFGTWKKVCKLYGYEEYDFPILEPFEIFAAKTGEEIVNQQLFSFEDKSGRKLAMRPEITPGTVRMLAARYKALVKPIRWFMIGNNWRYEQPQKGRGREFYQLEVNIFGSANIAADFEIFSIIIDLMKAFGANETMFSLSVSDRRLVTGLLEDALSLTDAQILGTRRLMDRRSKMSKDAFESTLQVIGLDKAQIQKVEQFMSSSFENLSQVILPSILTANEGYQNLLNLFELLKQVDLAKFCKFDPSIIRGFDYSDGLVYEVFDKNPKNTRSLFGGERFDKLIQIFGDCDLPATGFAMGDVTLNEFLLGWSLIPNLRQQPDFLVALWPKNSSDYIKTANYVATKLRDTGKSVVVWVDPNTKLEKQLKYANRKEIPQVVIIGKTELENNTVTIKDMQTGSQETKPLDNFLNDIS